MDWKRNEEENCQSNFVKSFGEKDWRKVKMEKQERKDPQIEAGGSQYLKKEIKNSKNVNRIEK